MTASKPKKTTAEIASEIAAQKKKSVSEAKTSIIESKLGNTKSFTIAEGTEHEYQVTLQFPGVFKASLILDDAVNSYGATSRTLVMQGAINNGVIASPSITGIDDFFNIHKGYNEVADKVYDFLKSGLE